MPDSYLNNEPQLLRQIANGDEQAFALLYHHYYEQLYPFVSKFADSQANAEEILQETFIRVWLYRDKLDSIDNFRAWLFKVSSRESLGYLRDKLHNRERLNRFSDSIRATSDNYTPEEMLHLGALKKLIKEAVQAMPEQRGKIYSLSRDRGLKAEEIATLLGISVQTVHNVLSTALKDIREHLKRGGYAFPAIIYLTLNIL